MKDANSSNQQDIKKNSIYYNFKQLLTLPSNVRGIEANTEQNIHNFVNIFHKLGFFFPEKLWNDVHLFGTKKSSHHGFFSNPKLVFVKLYQSFKQAGAYNNNFSSEAFFNSDLFNESPDKLADILSSKNLLTSSSNKNVVEKNNLVIKHLIGYWFQNAFSREKTEERINLLVNSQDLSTQQLFTDLQKTKLTAAILPQTYDQNYLAITGSSYYVMNETIKFTCQHILPHLVKPKTIFFQTGQRELSAPTEANPFLPLPERLLDAQYIMISLAEYADINLDSRESFKPSASGSMVTHLIPNYSSDNSGGILTETIIAKYMFYKKYAEEFSSFNTQIIDTYNEIGDNRPTTYTTAIQNFLKIIGDYLVDDYQPSEINIMLVTSGAPFILRQALSETRALDDTLEHLIYITSNYYFDNQKEFGKIILTTLQKPIPPTQIFIDILTHHTDCGLINMKLPDQISHLKDIIFIHPVGMSRIEKYFPPFIPILRSELGALGYEYLLNNVKTCDITVDYQSRENNPAILTEITPSNQFPGLEKIDQFVESMEPDYFLNKIEALLIGEHS